MSRREFSVAVAGLAILAALGVLGVVFDTSEAVAGGWPRGGLAGSPSFTGGAVATATTFPAGTAAAPSVAWTSDADGSGSGWYRQAANVWELSLNGTGIYRFTTSELRILSGALWNRTYRDTAGSQRLDFGGSASNVYTGQTAASGVAHSFESQTAITTGTVASFKTGNGTGEVAFVKPLEMGTVDGVYITVGDNNAGAPAAADCDNDAELGRISIDTTNERLYVCNGATRGWDYTALTD